MFRKDSGQAATLVLSRVQVCNCGCPCFGFSVVIFVFITSFLGWEKRRNCNSWQFHLYKYNLLLASMETWFSCLSVLSVISINFYFCRTYSVKIPHSPFRTCQRGVRDRGVCSSLPWFISRICTLWVQILWQTHEFIMGTYEGWEGETAISSCFNVLLWILVLKEKTKQLKVWPETSWKSVERISLISGFGVSPAHSFL